LSIGGSDGDSGPEAQRGAADTISAHPPNPHPKDGCEPSVRAADCAHADTPNKVVAREQTKARLQIVMCGGVFDGVVADAAAMRG
jgi:hypothetical protein